MPLRLRARREPPDGRMTVVEHLQELRYRIVVSVVAFVVGSIVAYTLYEPIYDLLTAPLDQAGRIGGVRIDNLYVPGVTTAFTLRLKVSMFAGIVLASPVVLYQLWRFITPGLEQQEKRYAVPFVLSSMVLFGIGVWFCFLILPTGIKFLLSFITANQEPLIQVHEYISFLIKMILAFGLAFEFPLVIVFLALAGVVSSRQLRGWRRYAIFVAFLVAAVATPSADPFSQTAMAAPLYILFELSIVVIRFVLKR